MLAPVCCCCDIVWRNVSSGPLFPLSCVVYYLFVACPQKSEEGVYNLQHTSFRIGKVQSVMFFIYFYTHNCTSILYIVIN